MEKHIFYNFIKNSYIYLHICPVDFNVTWL